LRSEAIEREKAEQAKAKAEDEARLAAFELARIETEKAEQARIEEEIRAAAERELMEREAAEKALREVEEARFLTIEA
jgi:hypothetical protein